MPVIRDASGQYILQENGNHNTDGADIAELGNLLCQFCQLYLKRCLTTLFLYFQCKLTKQSRITDNLHVHIGFSATHYSAAIGIVFI